MKKIPPLAAFVISVITLTSTMVYFPVQMPSDLTQFGMNPAGLIPNTTNPSTLLASDDLPPYFGKDSLPDPDATTGAGSVWYIASDDLPPYFGKDSLRA